MTIFPKITTLNDSYLAELGRLVAHFAILENTVVAAIQGLLKCPREECLTICCERSFRNLLDLASSLAKQSLTAQQPLLGEFDAMIHRAQALEDRRNSFVHSIYGMKPTGVAVRSKTTAKRKRGLHTTHESIEPATITSVAMEIAVLAGEMEAFLQKHGFGRGWI